MSRSRFRGGVLVVVALIGALGCFPDAARAAPVSDSDSDSGSGLVRVYYPREYPSDADVEQLAHVLRKFNGYGRWLFGFVSRLRDQQRAREGFDDTVDSSPSPAESSGWFYSDDSGYE